MAKFSGTNRQPAAHQPHRADPHARAGARSRTRAASATRATPSRTCSCSRPPTWSARTRSTSAPPTRDARFVDLVHEVTATNPAFIAGADVDAGKVGLAQYLRETMLMRSAAVVMAAKKLLFERRHTPGLARRARDGAGDGRRPGAFALTMIFRHTVATLALLFVYSIGGEIIVNLLPFDGAGRWSLGNNALGWLATALPLLRREHRVYAGRAVQLDIRTRRRRAGAAGRAGLPGAGGAARCRDVRRRPHPSSTSPTAASRTPTTTSTS